MAEKSETVLCATFLHIAGDEAIKVYNTFQFMAEVVNKIDELKKKFKEYCELCFSQKICKTQVSTKNNTGNRLSRTK